MLKTKQKKEKTTNRKYFLKVVQNSIVHYKKNKNKTEKSKKKKKTKPMRRHNLNKIMFREYKTKLPEMFRARLETCYMHIHIHANIRVCMLAYVHNIIHINIQIYIHILYIKFIKLIKMKKNRVVF